MTRYTLTRRLFLKCAPIATIAAGTAAIVAEPVVAEHPSAKVDRIGWELAQALNDYHGGAVHAVVYPSEKTDYAVSFMFDRPETQEQKVRRLIKNLQYEMSMLPIVKTVGGGTHEITFDGGGYLRLGVEDAAKDGNLVMVGFVPPLVSGRQS